MQNCRKIAAFSAKLLQNTVNLKEKYYGYNNI
nr:MAG TPA: Monopolin complex subunit CSM1, Ulp2p,Topoisomerase, cohibin, rDNA silencing, desumoylation.3A [Caudoviricetes sp.]